jgi:hypothetical protein
MREITSTITAMPCHGRAMRRWLLVVLAGCSDPVEPLPAHFALGSCGFVDIVGEDPGPHVPQGSLIEWSTNPPTSGPHFPIWAAWDRSYASLERGFWVHNLEHGAVVLAHRCDEGCPDEIAQLEAAVLALPDDVACLTPNRTRALVVADPQLPDGIRFAAVAWGAMYTATCVDPPAIAKFARDFGRRAPEDTCASGASLGGTLIE